MRGSPPPRSLGTRRAQDPVERGELLEAVRAVPGRLVDLRRGEQALRLVVAQRAHRHAAQAGEVADPQHACPVGSAAAEESSALGYTFAAMAETRRGLIKKTLGGAALLALAGSVP